MMMMRMMMMMFAEKGQDARLMKTGGVEIGKALADKSKGLFSANDWQCRT